MLWGRVVTAEMASHVPRQFCMALGSCKGIDLYLDGSQFAAWGEVNDMRRLACKASESQEKGRGDP